MKLRLIPWLKVMLPFALWIAGCSHDSAKSEEVRQLQNLIEAIGCKMVDDGSEFPLEDRDREFYQPVEYAIARIESVEPLDGYHGPTVGKYVLAVERYATGSEATKRAEEYLDLDRLAGVTGHDENELSKMTVRCWARAFGDKVYLLSTKAAMHSALENRTQYVLNGVTAYENNRSSQ